MGSEGHRGSTQARPVPVRIAARGAPQKKDPAAFPAVSCITVTVSDAGGNKIHVRRFIHCDADLEIHLFRRDGLAEILKNIREFLNDVFRLHALLEAEGWISCDFYDGCLLYDFASHRCHVIDLDHYVRGPFVNSMGRMFGSSRFMAPEEFQLGARIDTRTSVFHLGRLGQIVLGSRARLEVFDRACRDAPADRWRTVAEFVEAWESTRAWEDTRTEGE